MNNRTGVELVFEFELFVAALKKAVFEGSEESFVVWSANKTPREFGHVFAHRGIQQCLFGREIVEESSTRNARRTGNV